MTHKTHKFITAEIAEKLITDAQYYPYSLKIELLKLTPDIYQILSIKKNSKKLKTVR